MNFNFFDYFNNLEKKSWKRISWSPVKYGNMNDIIGLLHGYVLIKRGFKSRLGWRPLGAIINILKSDFRSFFK